MLLGLFDHLQAESSTFDWYHSRGQGHYDGDPSNVFIVPEGTTITRYAKLGGTIDDSVGRFIEQGKMRRAFKQARKSIDAGPNQLDNIQVFGPGDAIEDLVIKSPGELTIMSKSITTEETVRLSQLIREGMGDVHLATCAELKRAYKGKTFPRVRKRK